MINNDSIYLSVRVSGYSLAKVVVVRLASERKSLPLAARAKRWIAERTTTVRTTSVRNSMPPYQTFVGESYFPPGKRAAVCFTIDDIHPGTSSDTYEAGGDLDRGALGHMMWLQSRHPELKVTLFTTADWRQTSAFPRGLLRHLPYLRDYLYTAAILPKGTMQLDRHPQFVQFLRDLPNVDIGWHGLYHVHKGLRVGMEFQDEPVNVQLEKLQRIREIFQRAALPHVPGMCPPTWAAPEPLIEALDRIGNEFLASSRDIFTAVAAHAECNMSGLKCTPLVHACRVSEQVHFATNFQGTSPCQRAFEILEAGGILAIKSHIIKYAYGHISLDALDRVYCNYLDLLFCQIKDRFGDEIWWTSMNEMNRRIRETVWD
jgi:hypothetical protein